MNREFLAQCTAIAPLLEETSLDSEVPTIHVSDVPDHVVHSIAESVHRGDLSIPGSYRMMTMQFCLDALKVGDFLGHDQIIHHAAKEIASRLQGVSRDEMRQRVDMYIDDDEITSSIDLEMRNDMTWILTSQESVRHCSSQYSQTQ